MGCLLLLPPASSGPGHPWRLGLLPHPLPRLSALPACCVRACAGSTAHTGTSPSQPVPGRTRQWPAGPPFQEHIPELALVGLVPQEPWAFAHLPGLEPFPLMPLSTTAPAPLRSRYSPLAPAVTLGTGGLTLHLHPLSVCGHLWTPGSCPPMWCLTILTTGQDPAHPGDPCLVWTAVARTATGPCDLDFQGPR